MLVRCSRAFLENIFRLSRVIEQNFDGRFTLREMDEMVIVDNKLGELRHLPTMMLTVTMLATVAALMPWVSSRSWFPAIILLLLARYLLKRVAERVLHTGQDLAEILADLDVGVTVNAGQKFQSLCWMAHRLAAGNLMMLLLQSSSMID